MRKNALTICCFVCAFGAFGAFFRWLQNQICVDTATGVQKPGMLNVLVPLIIIAAAVVFWFLVRKKMETCVFASNMYETFRGTTPVFKVVSWVIGCIIILGGIVTWAGTRLDVQAKAFTFISVMAIITGATFPSICATAKKHFPPGLISAFSTMPILMFTFWLIACYMRNSSVPNVWSYGIEIVAVCAVITAFYYIAGYSFGIPRPFAGLYSGMLAAFLCIMLLADSRYFGQKMIIIGTAAMLLMYCWMIVGNMRDAVVSADSASKAAAAAIAAKPADEEKQPASDDAPVISAGAEINLDEPTIEAPAYKPESIEDMVNDIKNM